VKLLFFWTNSDLIGPPIPLDEIIVKLLKTFISIILIQVKFQKIGVTNQDHYAQTWLL
jgi:hypothetical protein